MLYLHIGTGKAGSTTIQTWLNSDSFASSRHEQIEAWGLGNCWKLAAYSGTEWSRTGFVSTARYVTHKEYDDINKTLMKAVHAEVNGREKTTDFVASSEYIWVHYGSEKERIQLLAEALNSIFGSVKIIVYCRDQASYVPSVYAQAVKGFTRTTKTFAAFIDEREKNRNDWDYYARLCLWANAFGDENIEVNIFSKDSFHRCDLIADFLKTIDDDFSEIIATPSSKNENISPTNLQLELIRYLNFVPRRHRRFEKIRKRLLPYILSRRISKLNHNKTRKFSEDQLRRLYKSNAQLNRRFLAGKNKLLPEA